MNLRTMEAEMEESVIGTERFLEPAVILLTSQAMFAEPERRHHRTDHSMGTSFSARQNAAIAGAAYLVTSATSFWNLYASYRLVGVDAAHTAANIIAHTGQIRLMMIFDIVTCGGCVVLNAALYELLAPVQRSLARLAALWRIAESGVYAATTANAAVALSLLTVPAYAKVFSPDQLYVLARLMRSGQAFGFSIAMVFLALGSSIYMYLFLRSGYIPRTLAATGMALSIVSVPGFLLRLIAPSSLAPIVAAVRGWPLPVLVAVTIIALPLVLFEVNLGLWLLIRGVKTSGSAREF